MQVSQPAQMCRFLLLKIKKCPISNHRTASTTLIFNYNPQIKRGAFKKTTFINLDFLPRVLSVRVIAAFMPSKWEPPSLVRMLLAYPRSVSVYASEHLVNQNTEKTMVKCSTFILLI
jgi:hypothetical protein